MEACQITARIRPLMRRERGRKLVLKKSKHEEVEVRRRNASTRAGREVRREE